MGLSRAALATTVLVGAVVVGSFGGRTPRVPAPGGETTLWLAATSLAVDRDLVFEAADRDRFAQAFGREPAGVFRSGDRLDPQALPALVATVGAWVSPRRGPFLVQGFLFALAAFALARGMRSRLGAGAPGLVAVALFGSAAFSFAFRLLPETLGLAAVAVGGAAVWGRGGGRVEVPDDVFRGDLTGGERLLRWLVAGLGFGVAATLSPALVLLAIPALAALPRRRRAAGAALFAAGWIAPMLAAIAVSGAPWEPLQPVADPGLFGWNLLYLGVGRHVGVLLYYLPLALLFASPAKDEGRRWIAPTLLLAALFSLVTAPFDFAGEGQVWGNPAFVPLFALAFFAAGRVPASGGLALALLVASPWLAPLWLAPRSGAPAGLGTTVRAALERARALAPFETTLRSLPDDAAVERAGVVLRSTGWEIFPEAQGRGLVFLGRHGGLAVYSPRPLSSVRLEFGEEAPSTLEVIGGEVGNTTYRPSGEVAFDVAVGKAARRHAVWWSASPVSVYFLEMNLGSAPAAPLRFDLALARPAAPVVGGEGDP